MCNILHHHRYMSANQFSVDAGQKTKLALESIAFYAHFSSRNYSNETFYSRKGQCSALFWFGDVLLVECIKCIRCARDFVLLAVKSKLSDFSMDQT